MNRDNRPIEERLRSAFRARTDAVTPDQLAPAAIPPGLVRRWFVPMLAAACVVLIAAGVAIAATTGGSDRDSAPAAPQPFVPAPSISASPTPTARTAPPPTTPSPHPAASVRTASPSPSSLGPLPTAKFRSWSGRRPSTIYFSGDAGNIVSDIHWSSWGHESALGSGRWGYDDCSPNCAQGKVTYYPASIRLFRPVHGVFTRARETQTGPHGRTFTFPLPDSIGAAS
jgi:hypothetical protein